MKRRLLAAIAIGTALLGVWATVFWLTLPGRMPTDADYQRANALIASHEQPGDVIVIAPAYAERGRQFLTAAPAMQGYDLAHDVYPGTKRQWLVALPELPRFSLARARRALAARGKSEGGERVGNLWVEAFDVAGPEVDYSFDDAVGGAAVSIAGRRPESCRFVGHGKHQCSEGSWNYVQAGWHEVQERPFHCIWAHPVNDGVLTIRFPEVPLHGALHGRAAFTDLAPTLPHGAPVFVGVLAGSQRIASFQFDNRPGLQSFDALLPAGLPPQGPVTFQVSTPNNAVRHFCFDAWLGP